MCSLLKRKRLRCSTISSFNLRRTNRSFKRTATPRWESSKQKSESSMRRGTNWTRDSISWSMRSLTRTTLVTSCISRFAIWRMWLRTSSASSRDWWISRAKFTPRLGTWSSTWTSGRFRMSSNRKSLKTSSRRSPNDLRLLDLILQDPPPTPIKIICCVSLKTRSLTAHWLTSIKWKKNM